MWDEIIIRSKTLKLNHTSKKEATSVSLYNIKQYNMPWFGRWDMFEVITW